MYKFKTIKKISNFKLRIRHNIHYEKLTKNSRFIQNLSVCYFPATILITYVMT